MSIKVSDVTYFLAAIVLLATFLLSNVYIKIVLVVAMCLWLLSLKEYISIFLVLFVLAVVYVQLLYSPSIERVDGKVVSLKDTYFVVKVNHNHIMVYGDFDVNFDDIVLVKGKVDKIASTKNRVGYSFENWATSRRISKVCYADEVVLIKKGNSLRNHVYRKIMNQEEDVVNIMKMFLFHIYDDIGWLYLGLSMGIHLSFIRRLIESVSSYFFIEKQVSIITMLFCVFIAIFYHFDLISCRFLFRHLLQLTNLSKKNRWGILVIVLLILFPNMIYELGFLLPICIGFVYSFACKRVYGISQMLVMWLQLVFNGYVSILQIFVARIIYPLFSFMYCVCFINIWIPFHFPLLLFSKLIDYLCAIELPTFHIVGKPFVWMSVLFILVIVQYVVTSNRKYVWFLVLLFLMNHYQNYWYGFSRVVYIDVGQGDCTLISLPFHKGNILIDTGGSISYDVAKDIVFPVISSYGIDRLDLVILTHDDYDHVGAFDSLSTLIQIKNVITDKNIEYVVNDFVMYDGLGNQLFEGDNENSLTACFSIYGSSFLVLGDITKEQEEILVRTYDDLHIDYLKVAHHGSNTSTSNHLLESIKPLFAFISCGDNNYYNHPSKEVVARLNGYQIPFFTTKDEGMIEIIITPIIDFLIMDKRIILNNKMR